jgi:hypothetical protein
MPNRCRARTRWIFAAFALCVATLGSCDGGRLTNAGLDSQAVVDTIAGVIRTTNGGAGLWTDSERWTVREQFRVGTADGPPETTFYGPLASVTVGPFGNIYVLEAQAPAIKVFAPDGTFLRKFGRAGRGPGELSSPAAMGWDSTQRLWIADAFSGRYTVFDSAGSYLKTVPRAARVQARAQHALIFDGSGTFIDEASDGISITFARVDTVGTVLVSLAPLNHIMAPRPGVRRTIIPPDADRTLLRYRSAEIWNLAPDGSLWFAESGALRYIHRAPLGDTVRIIEATHRDVTVDLDTRQAIEREYTRIGLDLSDYTIARPLNQALYMLDDGHLLVQIEDEVGAYGRVFDVYDPNGRFLGPVDFGFRISTRSVPAFRGDTIIAIAVSDELDVPYLIRATIGRPES